MEGVFVNGPINVARLEGEIFGIKKHIYIFMDFHNDITYQSQCVNIDNIDVSKYIVQQLKTSNKDITYDLFSETYRSSLSKKAQKKVNNKTPYMYRRRYIDEVNKILAVESISEKKMLSNVRYHYIDIREYLKKNINDLFYNLDSVIGTCASAGAIRSTDYSYIMVSLEKLSAMFNVTYTALFMDNKNNSQKKSKKHKNSTECENNNDVINIDIIKKFMIKITSKYKHTEIPNLLKELFDQIEKDFNYLNKLINKSIKLLNDFGPIPNISEINIIKVGDRSIVSYGSSRIKFLNFITELEKTVYELEMIATFNYALIFDLFFLRRFLDKDYVQNAIVYTGIAHSMIYIYVLIKLFNFKMTNISYIKKGTNMNTLNKFFKDKNINDVRINEVFSPPSIYQCSDMTDFPKHFE